MNGNKNVVGYACRPGWIQSVCPAPKRHLQRLILQNGLKTGLDIGCGGDSPLTSLRGANFTSAGIDIDAKSIEHARSKQIHDHYILGDFMSMQLEQSFDVVVLSHVIEHLDRDAGWEVLRRIEKISRHLVYVETPYGFLEQTDYDGNPFMRHLSGWFPHDFQSRGYSVYGSGPRWLCAPMGSKRVLSGSIRNLLTRMFQWYYFHRPSKAGTIAGIRLLDSAGNLRSV